MTQSWHTALRGNINVAKRCRFGNIHSIDHTYYNGAKFEGLTEEDKRKIKYTVYWAEERGLNYAAITDHDLAAPGLYAAEYAREEKLSLKIIPGIECEILMRDFALPPVHILDKCEGTAPLC